MSKRPRDARHDFRETVKCAWCGAPILSAQAVYLTLAGWHTIQRLPYCNRTHAINDARAALTSETYAQQEKS